MKSQTLQLKRPIGKTLIVASLILAILLPLLELAARLPLVNSLLPAPSIGSSHKKLDLNFSFLDRLVQEEGPVDCLFIGSSVVKSSIDPEIVSRIYEDATGQSIRCFNFGVSGFTPVVASGLAEILLRKYKPRVLAWGISPESFIKGAGRNAKEMLRPNPWYRYHMGDFNLQGWLTEHSLAFRYFLRFRIWLERPALSRELALRENGMSRYGFSRKNRVGNLEQIDLHDPEVNGMIPADHTLSISEKGIAALGKILSYKSQYKIVLIEIPAHESIEKAYQNSPGLRDTIRDMLVQKAAEENVPFIQSEHLELIPTEGWKNVNHMNVKGADIFSEWLGNQLAKEI